MITKVISLEGAAISSEQLFDSISTVDLVKALIKRECVNAGAIDKEMFISAIFINSQEVFDICNEEI